MLPLLVALVALASGAPPPSATITIEHRQGWSHEGGKPISVRIAGGVWRRVAVGRTTTPFDVAVPIHNAGVVFEVRAAPRARVQRRLAALVPGAKYRVVGNPCALWALDVDAADADEEGPVERLRVDASALPSTAFPIRFSTADGLFGTTTILDEPGVSESLALTTSAMCPRSGVRVTVRSGPHKRIVVDETLIAHPGRLHTLHFTKPGTYRLVVGGK